MTIPDALGILEAAHTGAKDAEWLRNVASAALPSLSQGCGLTLALEAIRAAAVAVDRVRLDSVPQSREVALEAWHALSAGHWTLLDHFERDGRHYFLAQPSETEPCPRPSLTRREAQIVELVAQGHSNKQIAYELGLSPSAISSQLASATRKLGSRSRIQTILAVRAAGDRTKH